MIFRLLKRIWNFWSKLIRVKQVLEIWNNRLQKWSEIPLKKLQWTKNSTRNFHRKSSKKFSVRAEILINTNQTKFPVWLPVWRGQESAATFCSSNRFYQKEREI